MELGLYDWRSGKKPRKEVLEYFKSKGYLREPHIAYKDNEPYELYLIEVESISVGRMIEELMMNYDIMFWKGNLCIDTKGFKFTQR